MKCSYRLIFFMFVIGNSIAGFAASPSSEKVHDGKLIDSGSFGVFQKGNRVGTETFTIYQNNSGSVIESEFKTENSAPAVQTSMMQLSVNGEIRRYEWKELSPGKAESEVVPNNEFLNQKWKMGPQDKDHEKPYLMPASTSILDDYFFIQREVLAWKFLAMTCSKQEKGPVQCPPNQRTQFATLNPHQQSSSALSAESVGREKIMLKTGPQELNKLEFKNDAGTWQLWLDDQWKIIRMSIAEENTQIERD